MSATPSFAPHAKRIEALAVKIRADLEGRILIEQFYGVMFCLMLYCFVRICHQLDARADAEARMSQTAEERQTPAAGSSGGGQEALRVRLRLVASRADDAPVAGSLADAGEPRITPPQTERYGRACGWHGRRWSGARSRQRASEKREFWTRGYTRHFRCDIVTYSARRSSELRRFTPHPGPLPQRERENIRSPGFRGWHHRRRTASGR